MYLLCQNAVSLLVIFFSLCHFKWCNQHRLSTGYPLYFSGGDQGNTPNSSFPGSPMTPRFESNSSLSMGSPRVALVPGMSMSHGGWSSGIPTVARKKDNTAGQPGLAWTLELMLSNESKEWQWQNCWSDQVICMMMFIQLFLPWAKWIIFYLDHLEDSQEVLSRKQGHYKGLWLLFKPYQKITASESRSVCPREIFHCINQGLHCVSWTIWLGLCICWPMLWDQPNLIIIEVSVVLRV